MLNGGRNRLIIFGNIRKIDMKDCLGSFLPFKNEHIWCAWARNISFVNRPAFGIPAVPVYLEKTPIRLMTTTHGWEDIWPSLSSGLLYYSLWYIPSGCPYSHHFPVVPQGHPSVLRGNAADQVTSAYRRSRVIPNETASCHVVQCNWKINRFTARVGRWS